MPFTTRIPILHTEYGYSVNEICQILSVHKSLVYTTLNYHWNFDICCNPFSRRTGRHRKLYRDDLNYIESLLGSSHTIYIDELQQDLSQKRGVELSIPTLARTLRRLAITHKQVSKRAAE